MAQEQAPHPGPLCPGLDVEVLDARARRTTMKPSTRSPSAATVVAPAAMCPSKKSRSSAPECSTGRRGSAAARRGLEDAHDRVPVARVGCSQPTFCSPWPPSIPPGRFVLTYAYIGIYIAGMARAATTTDAFNAVAEPRRREILDVLAGGERPVNDLVRTLGLAQPQVSKHLRVLREVGAVDVREDGRQRLYRLNGHALKPIHDWVKSYERSWSERFDQLDVVLDELKEKEEGDGRNDE